jgi:hypothetical protein
MSLEGRGAPGFPHHDGICHILEVSNIEEVGEVGFRNIDK